MDSSPSAHTLSDQPNPPGVLRNSAEADFGCPLGPASIFVVFWGVFPEASAIAGKWKSRFSDPFLQFWLNQALLRGARNGLFGHFGPPGGNPEADGGLRVVQGGSSDR